MNVAFYFVDSNYIEFLKSYEMEYRGFTCVPNTQYRMGKKFLFGMVMTIGEINYYVPVSSKIKHAPNNIVIRINKKKKYTDVGSLRFAYMIPVPNNMLIKVDFSKIKDYYRNQLIRDELAFCRRNIHKIIQQAEKTYKALTASSKQKLLKNACDFKLLEQAYNEYVANPTYYYHITAEDVLQLQKNNFNVEIKPSINQKGTFIVTVHGNERQAIEKILNNLSN